ncbi:MAG TPA: DUF4398 domain-containing protein [Gemmatimonadales bacterium]|jgi:hypothetical protein
MMPTLRFRLAPLLAAALLAACSHSTSMSRTSGPSPRPDMSMSPPSPDPRVGLRAGWMDAGEASWNLQVVSRTPPSAQFYNASTPGDRRLVNSDLAFTGTYAIQGNYSGWQIWDISNPAAPTLKTAYVCPGSQSDVSVYRNLLFVSGEATSGRLDCGLEGVSDSVSHERLRGLRIFDITDIAHPRYLANVQTCRGSHTHTVLADPRDPANVYVYISGTAPVRSPNELAGCSGALPEDDPNSALFRIEVIQVPLADPSQAHIVSHPRIFADLAAPPKHGEMPEDVAAAAAARSRFAQRSQTPLTPADSALRARQQAQRQTLATRGPTQCHDITVYPAIGLAGGACAGYGLLLDIRDPANPRRVGAVADSNFSFWHSATFNNDGTKILFSDEWGGGGQPRCRVTDHKEWGADAIFTLQNSQMNFQGYFKMPAAQTSNENCVAHNGSLIPIPGRDVMVQAWYQGGISIFDWTDAAHPREIAFFDRGPMDSTRMVDGGSWSVYWYNGVMVSSEISRGLDIFQLRPSYWVSQNEIDAAKSVHLDYLNAQGQPHFTWPATFALPRAYLDQLARSNGLATGAIGAARQALSRAERMSGAQRQQALTALATQLTSDAQGASDQAKVRMAAQAVTDLAATN